MNHPNRSRRAAATTWRGLGYDSVGCPRVRVDVRINEEPGVLEYRDRSCLDSSVMGTLVQKLRPAELVAACDQLLAAQPDEVVRLSWASIRRRGDDAVEWTSTLGHGFERRYYTHVVRLDDVRELRRGACAAIPPAA